MNKKSMFRWLTAGGAVLLIVLLSCAYSIVENESRWRLWIFPHTNFGFKIYRC